MQLQIRHFLILIVGFAMLTGCGSGTPTSAKYNDTNIKRLCNCYSMYQFSNGFRGPESEEVLKEFLKNDAGANVKLKRMGINKDRIDDIFTSERDGEPFKVRYGLRGSDANVAVVFESVGVDGRRMVALNPVVECDDAEYDAYWSGEKTNQEEIEEGDDS